MKVLSKQQLIKHIQKHKYDYSLEYLCGVCKYFDIPIPTLNTFIGWDALNNIVVENGNTAIGYNVLRKYENSFIQ